LVAQRTQRFIRVSEQLSLDLWGHDLFIHHLDNGSSRPYVEQVSVAE
jgi:hypothetical protein